MNDGCENCEYFAAKLKKKINLCVNETKTNESDL